MEVFEVIKPAGQPVPILISVPHCGTYFPEEIKSRINPELLPPDDTDFFVHKLYDFAPELGITMIFANYSRWVIDLNRDPQSLPLYDDGRIITALVPVTDFLGNNIYRNAPPPLQDEINDRIEKYYSPYHAEIQSQLNNLQNKFKHALLFDAHSIRKSVPSIHKEDFPDLILGDNQLQSAHPGVIETAWTAIEAGNYTSSHNYPFRGGHITRSFGNPQAGIHALQLEMAKVNYMDDSEEKYNDERAEPMREFLKSLFRKLITKLEQLNQ